MLMCCVHSAACVRVCVCVTRVCQVEWIECHDLLAGKVLPPEEQAIYMYFTE
jgi:hypothetical protein